jgi:hypothetical protein
MGKLLWGGLGLYYVGAAAVVGAGLRWAAPVLAVGAAALLAAGVGGTALVRWRQGGMERQVLLEATSIAFFVTVLGAGAAAAFGANLAPQWIYSFGLAAWLATMSVRTRHLTA